MGPLFPDDQHFGHVLDWYEEHCVCARGHSAVSRTTPTAQVANLIGTGFNPVMAITAFAELNLLTGSSSVWVDGIAV
jgi:hypothetical protein